MDPSITFQKLSHKASDLVLAVHHNLYGNRMVTASSDHHLRVWDKKGPEWVLTDTWRAHDGEITDVQFAPPFTGPLLASISTDTTAKLWTESPTQPPNSARRFNLLLTLPSKSLLPWNSLAFKPSHPTPLLALTTATGNLAIYEPRDPAYPAEWTDWFAPSDFLVADPAPPRSEETSFAVAWHGERVPAWKAVEAGLSRGSLGLAVAAMDVVKVYRTDKGGRLYVATELGGARDLVRGVAWANGAMRGYDMIATASKDGAVRVYEVHTPVTVGEQGGEAGRREVRAAVSKSGIGAGLAEMSRAGMAAEEMVVDPSRVRQEGRMVAELRGHHGAVWRVKFSFTGELLMSTGDDGTIRTWKKDIDGTWGEYAEIDVEALQQEEGQEDGEE